MLKKTGRGRGIRTLDILLPKQARYQAALYPVLFQVGSATRTRTWDPMINSHLLYRLSYRGPALKHLNSGSGWYTYPLLRRAILPTSAGVSTLFISFISTFYACRPETRNPPEGGFRQSTNLATQPSCGPAATMASETSNFLKFSTNSLARSWAA